MLLHCITLSVEALSEQVESVIFPSMELANARYSAEISYIY